MIPMPARTQIWVACGATDMRREYDGLAVLVLPPLFLDQMDGRIGYLRLA
jgi:hypothetical protein